MVSKFRVSVSRDTATSIMEWQKSFIEVKKMDCNIDQLITFALDSISYRDTALADHLRRKRLRQMHMLELGMEIPEDEMVSMGDKDSKCIQEIGEATPVTKDLLGHGNKHQYRHKLKDFEAMFEDFSNTFDINPSGKSVRRCKAAHAALCGMIEKGKRYKPTIQNIGLAVERLPKGHRFSHGTLVNDKVVKAFTTFMIDIVSGRREKRLLEEENQRLRERISELEASADTSE